MAQPLPKLVRDKMFAAYFANPTLAYVMRQAGVCYRTAERYRMIDRWDDRIHEMDKQLTEAVLPNVAAIRAERLRTLRALAQGFADGVAEGTIRVETVGDYAQVVKLEYLLLGGPTDRVDHAFTFNGKPYAELSDVELQEARREIAAEVFRLRDSIARTRNPVLALPGGRPDGLDGRAGALAGATHPSGS